jgi:hypothetical protein
MLFEFHGTQKKRTDRQILKTTPPPPPTVGAQTRKSRSYAQLHLVLIIPVKFGCNCTCSFLGVVLTRFVTDRQTEGQRDRQVDGREVIPLCSNYFAEATQKSLHQGFVCDTPLYTKSDVSWHY